MNTHGRQAHGKLGAATIGLGAVLVGVIAASSPAHAQTTCSFYGQRAIGFGSKSTLRAELNGKAGFSAPSTSRSSEIKAAIRACLIGKCADLAYARLRATATTSAATGSFRIWAAGKTLYLRTISGVGSLTSPTFIQDYPIRSSYPIVPGVATASVKAGFGAGANLTASYRMTSRPLLANLSGGANAWAYGNGEVKASILEGIGGYVKAVATLESPAAVLTATLDTARCAKGLSDADLLVTAWDLYLKLKWGVLCLFGHCVYEGSRTLFDQSFGSAISYDIL